jgi:hypothetical protein
MALTYRGNLSRPLTVSEIDGNFAHFTGSHAITGSLTISGSPALIATGNLSILGTASADVYSGRVDGTSGTFSGTLTAASSLNVTGIASFNNRLEVTGSLVVSGSNATIVVPHVTSGQPSTPLTGSMYIDIATSLLYVYNGTAWKSASLS